MSCVECQRRKQKCDRQWPCNRCQNRKIGHLCKYDSKTIPAGPSILGKRQQPSQNAALEDSPISAQLSGIEVDFNGPTSSLKNLGYMQEDLQAIIGDVAVSEGSSGKAASLSPEVKEWLRAIPPRPYTDILVKNFFDDINFIYCILHPASFMDAYTAWWSNRHHCPNITFSSLLLQVCAMSMQYLPDHLATSLQNDLGDTIQAMTDRYHDAAEQLNRQIPLGEGGLEQVQQLLLSSTWCKGEGQMIESWHILSEAIRIAQEIGLHKESKCSKRNGFECHMRQRTWWNLHFADAYMSAILNRPTFINEKYTNPSLPDLAIELDPSNPDVPPPLECRILEYQLADMIPQISDVKNRVPLDTAAIYKIKGQIDAFVAALPPAYSYDNPDTRWDAKITMHILNQITLLMLLKPVIKQNVSNREDYASEQVFGLQQAIITSCISVIRACRQLFDRYMPNKRKFYTISFYPFDCAADLCRLLLHDTDKKLSAHRKEILSGIEEASFILTHLQHYTAVARRGKSILDILVSKLQSTEQETLPLKKQRRMVDSDSFIMEHPTNHQLGDMDGFAAGVAQQGMLLDGLEGIDGYSNIDLEQIAAGLGPVDNVDLGSFDWGWGEQ
ncbi:fungal-specific transcription factor domain-containing protein [Xylogone sp. PMI_703]|nr:fungal-specific transcription factor domain-containing protein [Xylogone sp. PMI_703]